MSIQMDRMHTLASRPPPIVPVSTHLQMPAPSNAVSRGAEKPPSPEHPSASSNDDRQSQMEQSLKRSITLVIWYKPACDPIRLNHEISTFPLFQLSHFPSVVSDLELTPASYIDTYNNATGNWEQHVVTTVRTIETDQRLLYKLRKSLLSGLLDEECRGLAEELALQPKKKQTASPTILTQNGTKRPATEHIDGPPAKRPYPPEGYPHPMYIPQMGYMYPQVPLGHPMNAPPVASPSNVNSPEGEISPSMPNPYSGPPATPMSGQPPNSPGQYPGVSPSSATRTGPGAAFPQHPHPPLKRWPNDYTVSEIATGFRQMDALIAQTPNATQRTAFERIFGCRYVKSTVCRHRGVYRKADTAVRGMFEGMGTDERAVWGEFVRRVEGRPSGKQGQGEELALQGDVHEGGSQPGPVQQEQRGGTNTGPLMDSLVQSPHMTVPSPPSGMPHINGHVPVYDPSLADKDAGLCGT
ncbi:uncharacterized protein EDB91DRAFT_1133850 [Suillus paluster]|uniref:uncharacterized protein n=1 Tax=Suillus paluster TaxID=48578 RepID=UPI001B877ACF|nr:uncharacterized protein EDB91DRAFT_1133850 [Suillus paluster]KAG1740234.1 hypothetical protein EDB91DRAFT_1133850 [Suillus paluster]